MLMPMASYTYERIKPLNDINDIERHLDALYNLTELADASKILLGAQYRSKGGLRVNRYYYSYQRRGNKNGAKVPFYVLCIFIRPNCRTSLINKRFIIWPKWNDCLVGSKFREVKVESKFNAWFCLLADQNKIHFVNTCRTKCKRIEEKGMNYPIIALVLEHFSRHLKITSWLMVTQQCSWRMFKFLWKKCPMT